MRRTRPHLTRPGSSSPHSGRCHAALKRAKSQNGQALVEFALVLPIILLVLLGIVLFGVALNDWIDETQLASEAARFAAVNNEHGEGPEIKEVAFLKWVTEQGDNGNVKEAKATMCSPTSKLGDYVEVKLTYTYKWFGLANLLGVEAETPLTATARNRIEDQPATAYPTTC
jgi:uncharacterized protein (UPF0333 family)